jgi:hypothetical protein
MVSARVLSISMVQLIETTRVFLFSSLVNKCQPPPFVNDSNPKANITSTKRHLFLFRHAHYVFHLTIL